MASDFDRVTRERTPEEAHRALVEACRRGHLRMTVPAQADDDDMVIGQAIEQWEKDRSALSESERLREEAERERGLFDHQRRNLQQYVDDLKDERQTLQAEAKALRAALSDERRRREEAERERDAAEDARETAERTAVEDRAAFCRAEAQIKAMRGALRNVALRSVMPIDPKVRGLPATEKEMAAAIVKCARLVVEFVAEPARALAASPSSETERRPPKPLRRRPLLDLCDALMPNGEPCGRTPGHRGEHGPGKGRWSSVKGIVADNLSTSASPSSGAAPGAPAETTSAAVSCSTCRYRGPCSADKSRPCEGWAAETTSAHGDEVRAALEEGRKEREMAERAKPTRPGHFR